MTRVAAVVTNHISIGGSTFGRCRFPLLLLLVLLLRLWRSLRRSLRLRLLWLWLRLRLDRRSRRWRLSRCRLGRRRRSRPTHPWRIRLVGTLVWPRRRGPLEVVAMLELRRRLLVHRRLLVRLPARLGACRRWSGSGGLRCTPVAKGLVSASRGGANPILLSPAVPFGAPRVRHAKTRADLVEGRVESSRKH